MNKKEIQTIDSIIEAISSIIEGEIPQMLDLKEHDNHKIKELFETTNWLIESLSEANDFIASLAQGKLNIEVPVRNNLVSQFKQLHSNLRHLTWQVQQIARGDYNQTVDFLGDFSDNFNSMIAALKEKKQVEERLRESEEKLARAKKMEALGLLAGGVAHDLNNVLSGIVSYPELLLFDLPEDSKFRKPIETMQESGHRVAAIVQDLLTVARGVATTKEPLNLNVIIEDYLLSPEFKKLEQFHPTVTFKTNLDTDLLNISGSDAHLRKVVMNLVSNASEAIEGSGNVIISTMNRSVDRPIRGYDDVNVGEFAVLSVSDDGPGISSDDLERILNHSIQRR